MIHHRVAIGVLLAGLTAASARAQTAAMDSVSIATLRRNFAVPESPAMTLLDVDSSKILHPGSARELGVDLANAANGSPTIPSALAVEFSPFLIANGRKTPIGEYQRWQALYRTRLSLATKHDSSHGRTQFAVGLRTSFIDHSDPRTSPAVTAAIKELDAVKGEGAAIKHFETLRRDSLSAHCLPRDIPDSAQIESYVTEAQVRATAQCLSDRHRVEAPAAGAVPLLVESQRQVARAIFKQFTTRFDSANTIIAQKIQKASAPDTLWNQPVLDVAIAMRGSSDSIGRGMQTDNYSAWVTAGTGFTTAFWWLFGANAAVDRDTSGKHAFRGSEHLVTRFYAGANAYKAFLEIQSGAAVGNRASWVFDLGGELSLGGGFWVNATAGYAESGPHTGRIIDRISIKAGLPGGS